MTRVSIEVERVSNGYFVHLNHGNGAVVHAVDDHLGALLQRIANHFISSDMVRVTVRPSDPDKDWVEGM